MEEITKMKMIEPWIKKEKIGEDKRDKNWKQKKKGN